jgi:hypothetical protein
VFRRCVFPAFVRLEVVVNHIVPVELSATASWILIGVTRDMEYNFLSHRH